MPSSLSFTVLPPLMVSVSGPDGRIVVQDVRGAMVGPLVERALAGGVDGE